MTIDRHSLWSFICAPKLDKVGKMMLDWNNDDLNDNEPSSILHYFSVPKGSSKGKSMVDHTDSRS